MSNAQSTSSSGAFVPKPLSSRSDIYVEEAWNEHLADLPSRAIPLFSLIDVVSSLGNQFHKSALKPLGYSHTEYAILGTLLLNGSSMQPSFFTRMLANASAGTSQILNRLEKQELLYRESSPSDKRSVLVGLTDKGREVAYQLCEAEAKASDRAAKELSDEDLLELRHALGKLVQILY